MNNNDYLKNEVLRKLQDPKFYADVEPVTYTNDAISKYTNNQAHDVKENLTNSTADIYKIL